MVSSPWQLYSAVRQLNGISNAGPVQCYFADSSPQRDSRCVGEPRRSNSMIASRPPGARRRMDCDQSGLPTSRPKHLARARADEHEQVGAAAVRPSSLRAASVRSASFRPSLAALPGSVRARPARRSNTRQDGERQQGGRYEGSADRRRSRAGTCDLRAAPGRRRAMGKNPDGGDQRGVSTGLRTIK